MPAAAEPPAAATVPTVAPPTPVPPTPVPPTSVPATATPAPDLVPVVAVVDGDTLKVSLNNTIQTVRLIGIDTPEVVDPRTPVQCFGREASARAKELLTGARVRLEQDPTQDSRDKYGRLLAYVWLQDGRLLNRELIAQGFAHEYTYALPYQYQASFKDAERQAREQGLGLWSPETCNGQTSTAALAEPTKAAVPPTLAPSRPPAPTTAPTQRPVVPASPPTAVSPGAPYYKNCAAARTAGAAPLRRGQPGYRPQLDGDSDGIACE
jgi:micrococcal nuclease